MASSESGESSADLDLATLQREWEVPEPQAVQPLTRGTNNRALRLSTAAGDYVLRVYSNHADLARLRFELRVLAHLEQAGLPFAVPVPLSARSGARYVRIGETNEAGIATLARLIPGEHPRPGDLDQARAGGEALGALDLALATVVPDAPDDGVSWRSTGDLAHCHPLVPDPPDAFQDLPVAEDVRARLLAGYARVMTSTPALYATLPQQIVHEDFDMSNVLLGGSRVTGVLDFEFCGRDVRVMDIVVALNWWPLDYLGTGGEWPIIESLLGGYARYITLTEEEIVALPHFSAFRAYTSLIHRLGRYRQGLSTLEEVAGRVAAAIEREDWLAAHGERLVRVARRFTRTDPAREISGER